MSPRTELINRVLKVMNDPKFAVSSDNKFKRVICIMPDLSILVEMEDPHENDKHIILLTEYVSDYWRQECSTEHGKMRAMFSTHIILTCYCDIYNTISYYHVPRYAESWVIGAMNYIFRLNHEHEVIKLYIREGAILLLFRCWKINITKLRSVIHLMDFIVHAISQKISSSPIKYLLVPCMKLSHII